MKSKNNLFVRDISWLEFNERVMQEAMDEKNALYDRLRFLGIFSNNQDEFFRVRVAALNRMKQLGKTARMHLEEQPGKILKKIGEKVRAQSRDFDRTYAIIIKEMAAVGIAIKNEKQLNAAQKEFVQQYFAEQVRTNIVPLMIESIPKFPLLKDDAIYLACLLGSSQHNLTHLYSLIEIPTKVLPRFIPLPSPKGKHDFILLEDVIRLNLSSIFAPFGLDRFSGHIIKVTRDAEFTLDNDLNTNLILELEEKLKTRKKGKTTRFVYDKAIDEGLLQFLLKRLQVDSQDAIIPGSRIHNFKDFMQFPKEVFPPKSAAMIRKSMPHPDIHPQASIMEEMERKDILLSLPYHQFDPLIDLLREAAIDPFVQSIHITCYRLAKNSKIVNALINAARNGKKVTAVLELKARFDEEANLEWHKALADEGVTVLLGIPNMKVHAKLCLIRKKRFEKIKQYGFLSTGNFNENTAKIYADYCLLTCNKDILNEVKKVFQFLENPLRDFKTLKALQHLILSPTSTRSFFMDCIQQEINAAKKGKPAGIFIKLNSLVDEQLILQLYKAASAGVEVRLIIRGVFCAVPVQSKFKKDIQAVSIVDEYLEHARVMIFHNNNHPKVFLSSADWMVRNLDHRVEVSFPIYDDNIRQEIIDMMEIQWQGNVKARILDNKQMNKYVQRNKNEKIVRSQQAIFDYLYNKSIPTKEKAIVTKNKK